MVCFMQKGVSVLDSSFLANGDFFSEGCIDISGRFIGNIVAESVSVKKGGNIEGEIYVNELTVADGGIIKGNVTASESIKVLAEAAVIGDVISRKVQIDGSALIHGHCISIKDENEFKNISGQYFQSKAIKEKVIL